MTWFILGRVLDCSIMLAARTSATCCFRPATSARWSAHQLSANYGLRSADGWPSEINRASSRGCNPRYVTSRSNADQAPEGGGGQVKKRSKTERTGSKDRKNRGAELSESGREPNTS